jgi:hypothetical protein
MATPETCWTQLPPVYVQPCIPICSGHLQIPAWHRQDEPEASACRASTMAASKTANATIMICLIFNPIP